MATGAVVTATYKTIKAILEANDMTFRDLTDRHADFEYAETQRLRQKVKELEDQVFHFTDGIKPIASEERDT